MIFLGAGASKPFGIPTLEEFSKIVCDKLEALGHKDVLVRIRDSLKEFNLSLDFESLYSILEGLVNPQMAVTYAGPLTAYLIGKKDDLPKSYDYSKVLRDLRKEIYKQCRVDSERFKVVEGCYEKLLEVTEKNTSSESIYNNPPQTVSIGKVFATTNYDMSLELYFYRKNTQVIDGFEETGGFVKYYNPSLLLNPYESKNSRTIIKLHGSIFQFLKGDQMIKTKLDPSSKALPFKINVGSEMMIYPTREKDVLIEPYFSFFSTFKNINWSKLLVIGYSFRDEPINNAIIERMKIDENSQLIVIDPKVEEVVDNLYSNISPSLVWTIPNHRLFKYQGKFGSSEVYEYLKRIERVSNTQDLTFDPSKLAS